jgi:hypothetical protein
MKQSKKKNFFSKFWGWKNLRTDNRKVQYFFGDDMPEKDFLSDKLF